MEWRSTECKLFGINFSIDLNSIFKNNVVPQLQRKLGIRLNTEQLAIGTSHQLEIGTRHWYINGFKKLQIFQK